MTLFLCLSSLTSVCLGILTIFEKLDLWELFTYRKSFDLSVVKKISSQFMACLFPILSYLLLSRSLFLMLITFTFMASTFHVLAWQLFPFFLSWRLKYFFLVFMIHFKCCTWIKGPPPFWALSCHKIVYWEDCLHSTELLFSVFTKITLPYGSGSISRPSVLFQRAISLFIADTLRPPCFYHVLWESACHVFSILSMEKSHIFY